MSRSESDTTKSVRGRLEQARPGQVTDARWGFLWDDGAAQELAEDPVSDAKFQRLLGLFDQVRDAFGEDRARRPPSPRPVPSPTTYPVSARERALTRLAVHEAGLDPAVRFFRRMRLSSPGSFGQVRLLPPEAIHPWISAKTAGEPTEWVEVALTGRRARRISESRMSRWSQTLHYAAPTGAALPADTRGWRNHRVATIDLSPLDDLRQVSERLSGRFEWPAAVATVWVLTGFALPVREIRWTHETAEEPAFSRLTLRVDPTATPVEVARAYGALRTRVLGARHRDQTEKHLQLATVALERSDTWSSEMRGWNDAYPEWRYSEWKIFQRDAAKALKRLRGATSEPV